MIINSLSEINLNESNFPIYFSEKWKKQEINQDYRSKIYFFVNEELQAIIPFKITRLKFLKKGEYLFIPLNYKGIEFNETYEKLILDEFHKSIKNLCDVILPPQHVLNFKSIPSKVTYFRLGIIYIDLSQDEETIFQNFSSTYRNEIRKAQTNKVIINSSLKNFKEFYKVYTDVHKKQNLSYDSEELFENQLINMPENILIYTSKYQGHIESAIYCLKDDKNCYYLYSGVSRESCFAGSNKYLLWSLIKDLKSQGVQKLILGGYRPQVSNINKLYGIQRFKLKFGASIQEGYHFLKVNNLWKYRFFTLALKTYSFLTNKSMSIFNPAGVEIKYSK